MKGRMRFLLGSRAALAPLWRGVGGAPLAVCGRRLLVRLAPGAVLGAPDLRAAQDQLPGVGHLVEEDLQLIHAHGCHLCRSGFPFARRFIPSYARATATVATL